MGCPASRCMEGWWLGLFWKPCERAAEKLCTQVAMYVMHAWRHGCMYRYARTKGRLVEIRNNWNLCPAIGEGATIKLVATQATIKIYSWRKACGPFSARPWGLVAGTCSD